MHLSRGCWMNEITWSVSLSALRVKRNLPTASGEGVNRNVDGKRESLIAFDFSRIYSATAQRRSKRTVANRPGEFHQKVGDR